jgi:hypothetical protein
MKKRHSPEQIIKILKSVEKAAGLATCAASTTSASRPTTGGNANTRLRTATPLLHSEAEDRSSKSICGANLGPHRAGHSAFGGQTRRERDSRTDFGRQLRPCINRRAAREGEDCCNLKALIRQRDADSGKQQLLTLHRDIRFRPSSPPVWRRLPNFRQNRRRGRGKSPRNLWQHLPR